MKNKEVLDFKRKMVERFQKCLQPLFYTNVCCPITVLSDIMGISRQSVYNLIQKVHPLCISKYTNIIVILLCSDKVSNGMKLMIDVVTRVIFNMTDDEFDDIITSGKINTLLDEIELLLNSHHLSEITLDDIKNMIFILDIKYCSLIEDMFDTNHMLKLYNDTDSWKSTNCLNLTVNVYNYFKRK